MAIRRCRLEVDIIYDDTVSPSPSLVTLATIGHQGDEGDYSVITKDLSDVVLTHKEVQAACAEHGTDPAFFLGDPTDEATTKE